MFWGRVFVPVRIPAPTKSGCREGCTAVCNACKTPLAVVVRKKNRLYLAGDKSQRKARLGRRDRNERILARAASRQARLGFPRRALMRRCRPQNRTAALSSSRACAKSAECRRILHWPSGSGTSLLFVRRKQKCHPARTC